PTPASTKRSRRRSGTRRSVSSPRPSRPAGPPTGSWPRSSAAGRCWPLIFHRAPCRATNCRTSFWKSDRRGGQTPRLTGVAILRIMGVLLLLALFRQQFQERIALGRIRCGLEQMNVMLDILTANESVRARAILLGKIVHGDPLLSVDVDH